MAEKKRGWREFLFGKGELEKAAKAVQDKKKKKKDQPASPKSMDYLKKRIAETMSVEKARRKKPKKGQPPIPKASR
jgi:hypothetical protein